jgi:hypothetical protein
MLLEYSEEQQAFHINYGDHKEGSNGYNTILSGTYEQIDALQPLIHKAKNIRDNGGHLTFERAKSIIVGE